VITKHIHRCSKMRLNYVFVCAAIFDKNGSFEFMAPRHI